MGKVSGLFQDLTTIKKARNGRLASWDQRGKNQDYWEIPAKESIVLLKNDGILPLDIRKIKTIGVVGPNADSRASLIGNYHGTSS